MTQDLGRQYWDYRSMNSILVILLNHWLRGIRTVRTSKITSPALSTPSVVDGFPSKLLYKEITTQTYDPACYLLESSPPLSSTSPSTKHTPVYNLFLSMICATTYKLWEAGCFGIHT